MYVWGSPGKFPIYKHLRLLIAHIGHAHKLLYEQYGWADVACMGSTSDYLVHGDSVVRNNGHYCKLSGAICM